MAARTRNASWMEDLDLKEELQKYVRQGLKRDEILNFMERDFGDYAWSLRTLDRRMRHFDIRYTNTDVTVEEVKSAVRKELDGPGKLLGYRAMHNKIRQEYLLNVPRNLVHAVMFDLDSEGLEARCPTVKKGKTKGHFSTKGTNWVHSMDGHDKLMGYQNSTFPLAIYGSINKASRKILWLKIWTGNADPKRIARWYLEHLYENRTIASHIRIDRGNETGIMATMHSYLRQSNGDMNPFDTAIYGPSTSNQIERWWKELHERLEKYFKEQLAGLKGEGYYNPHDEVDRKLLSYLLIPVVQRQLDLFQETVWNSHRIRTQKNTVLPDGVPDHIYNFPEEYGLEECGFPVTEEQLRDVAQHSGVLEIDDDFIESEFRTKCARIIPMPVEHHVEPAECAEAYKYLKRKFSQTV